MNVVKVSRNEDGVSCRFYCPGCKNWHVIPSRSDGGQPSWDFNGDEERPTFSPSILVTLPPGTRANADPRYVDTLSPDRCHSFVRDGRIEFLSDSTHELSGQTVDLPPVDGGTAP